MQKLRRKIEFLETGKQRVRMRLNRIHQDPLLTPTTSLSGIKPKMLIGPEYHDYPEYDHYGEQMIHEHAIYADENELIKKQIRADALLSRSLQQEERDQALKQNKQVEYDVPSVHHIDILQIKMESNDEQFQDTDYFSFFMAYQAPHYCNRQEIENPTLRVTS